MADVTLQDDGAKSGRGDSSDAVEHDDSSLASVFYSPEPRMNTATTAALAARASSQAPDPNATSSGNSSSNGDNGAAQSSTLTPLVADLLALATPVPATSNAAMPPVSNVIATYTTEETVNECASHEPERVGGTRGSVKRYRRALFDVLDSDATATSTTANDVLETPLDSHRHAADNTTAAVVTTPTSSPQPPVAPLDDHATAPSVELELERELATAAAAVLAAQQQRSSASAKSPANAFDTDADADAEHTLVIRQKRKRSLLLLPPRAPSSTPIESAAERTSSRSDRDARNARSQPLRPSFVRSMSSQSIFLSKPIGNGTAEPSSLLQSTGAGHTLVLPTVLSKAHPDLNVIAPETVARLLRGDFATQLTAHALVDCRFPYEFAGGSLRTAQSLSDPAQVEQLFLLDPPRDCVRMALVFFCEFSATRAPKMLRHVRNLDRWIHAEAYPQLFYPELYLIDGGYKHCFETIPDEICMSNTYTSMSDSAFVQSCKREFALWRKHWRAHKTSSCAAKLQLHHHTRQTASSNSSSSTSDSDALASVVHADDDASAPALHPLLPLRSFSESH